MREGERAKDKNGATVKEECEIDDYPAAFWMKKRKKGGGAASLI